jgi:phage baseplate assembly protein W
MARADYQFPFRIDSATGQTARIGYASHVGQMIRQLLLTSPGERIDLPEFGCGLRRMLFAPNADFQPTGPTGSSGIDALHATTQVLIREALERWLAGQVVVQDVTVTRNPDAGLVQIELTYQLVETRSTQLLELTVGP